MNDSGGARIATNNASFQLSTNSQPICSTMVSESRISAPVELVAASATCSILKVSRDSIVPVDCWS
jgi:hypothetical protein